ncbi:Dyp-type peroxidase [Microbacterium gorillae]|uniref:Dyp-type peroxidase n=1 Tax=Microbacterium gorillae TaxID=1231063 RepID=UPI000693F9A0|nr:Dyp-type peroxidase [Microbacterium gorillae]
MARIRPQNIIATPARCATFLTLTIQEGHEAAVTDVLSDIGGVIRSVAFREPEQQLIAVIGIGADAWDRMYDAPRPPGLHPFRELDGGAHTAPSTPGDLLVHIRAHRPDLCFELGRRVLNAFGDAVRVEDEVQGFRFFDERDLLGFVDGTENPNGIEAEEAVLVPDGPWQGSSFVIVQKYEHDLSAWDGMTTEQQEAAIGRTKLSDVEFADADKAPNAHLTLNTIEDDGVQRKIVRDNLPFGSLADGTFGTYFIGYAADVDVTERMLRNMFLGQGEATHDRILDFSTALTGANFFVPTENFLEDPKPTLASARDAAEGGPPAPVE